MSRVHSADSLAIVNSVAGPNGALIRCMEFLEDEIEDWLLPEINNATLDEDLLLLDCPGQIELTTHNRTLRYSSVDRRVSMYIHV